MAIKGTKTTPATKPAYDQADAWLNLVVVDAAGNKHRLPKGLAMYLKDKLSAQMIKAASEIEVIFKLEGTITVPSADDVIEQLQF